MKKLLILAAAFALTTGAASAQTDNAAAQGQGQGGGRQGGAYANMTPEQRADAMSKRLTEQLTLTPDQTEKVRQVSLSQSQQMAAVRAKYASSDDRQAMRPEMQALRDQQDTKLKEILTAEQYTKYTQTRDERGGARGGQAGPALTPPPADQAQPEKAEKGKVKKDKTKLKS
jgi:hypothetical protein